MTTVGRLPAFSSLTEPLLAFSATNARSVHRHPLIGLQEFGPFTSTSMSRFTPHVRVAIVGPDSAKGQRRDLFQSLRQKHTAQDRSGYVPDYPGFADLFRLELTPAPAAAQLSLPEVLADNREPTAGVHDAFRSALTALEAVRDLFDVAVFHLPDAWSDGLRTDDFDAHHVLKGLAAPLGIPTQVLNDRTFEFEHTASRSWRLGIATYVKGGGVPWKLAPLDGVPPESAYIGLAYGFRGNPRNAEFVTCCSQVFDADGGGMQFVAYDARDVDDLEAVRRNPYLSRDDMRAVMAQSLELYQRRNGGRTPRRIVVHKTTAFTDGELEGALDALAGIPEVECINITPHVAWRGVWLKAPRDKSLKSDPDGYPVRRGTMVPLSGSQGLLWVAGNVEGVSTRGNYFQGGKSIPSPVLFERQAGKGSLDLAAVEILALSKMDWNNDALYDPAPVTIRYSQRLATTIAQVPSLPRAAYPYRMFM